MNKDELFEFFEGKVSKTCMKRWDDGYSIFGKWAIVSPFSGGIDLFICNQRDMRKGLGQRKVNNIVSAIKSAGKVTFTELDGEAHTTLPNKQVVLDNLKLLGIRKKKVVTNAGFAK